MFTTISTHHWQTVSQVLKYLKKQYTIWIINTEDRSLKNNWLFPSWRICYVTLIIFIALNCYDEKNKDVALKNAYVLMGRHELELVVNFFFHGGDIASSINGIMVHPKIISIEVSASLMKIAIAGNQVSRRHGLNILHFGAVWLLDNWDAIVRRWGQGMVFHHFIIDIVAPVTVQINNEGYGSVLEEIVEALCRHVSDDSPMIRRLCLRGLSRIPEILNNPVFGQIRQVAVYSRFWLFWWLGQLPLAFFWKLVKLRFWLNFWYEFFKQTFILNSAITDLIRLIFPSTGKYFNLKVFNTISVNPSAKSIPHI
ncbi:hypothetical protein LXL04_010255 [Taraxacum kok-saghyz]